MKIKTILKQSVIHDIMDRAVLINKENKLHCRDFQIMISTKIPHILILRWTTIDCTDQDIPVQCYRYECFTKEGVPQLCSIYYTNQNEANEFFWSLESLYHQNYAIDHKL